MTEADRKQLEQLAVTFINAGEQLQHFVARVSSDSSVELFQLKKAVAMAHSIVGYLMHKARSSFAHSVKPPVQIKDDKLRAIWVEAAQGVSLYSEAFKRFKKLCAQRRLNWVKAFSDKGTIDDGLNLKGLLKVREELGDAISES